MDPFKYTFLAHDGMAHCNPISVAKAEQVMDLMPLGASALAVDVGCGKAEMLLRVLERSGCSGLGIDRSPHMIGAARQEARRRGVESRIEFREQDGGSFQPSPGSFDAALCIGATEALGGFRACIQKLAGWLRPGGFALLGEGFWRREPEPEFLGALEATPEDYLSHSGNVEAGVASGLIPHYAAVSSEDEWDRYEWLHCRNIELYAAGSPGDADVPARLARRRAWRNLYLRHGRDTLGFGLYLFKK